MSNSATSSSPSAEKASPGTPSPSVRIRNVHGSPDQSPSTTISGSDTLQSGLINEIPRSTFRGIFASSMNTNKNQLVARSDPLLLTCFDPSDKELYDLWAPQTIA